jgi:hypothetical protein
MLKTNKNIIDGQSSSEPLTKKEKIGVIFLCIFNPIIAGTILYYGWKKKLPIKAHQANQISLWVFFVMVVLGIVGAFLGIF